MVTQSQWQKPMGSMSIPAQTLLAIHGSLSDKMMSHPGKWITPVWFLGIEGVKWREIVWADMVCQTAIMDDVTVLDKVLG